MRDSTIGPPARGTLSQTGEQRQEVRGQGRFEPQPPAARRMIEAQTGRVQGHARERGRGLRGVPSGQVSILRVAVERMAPLGEVNANLMGAARFESALDEREIA